MNYNKKRIIGDLLNRFKIEFKKGDRGSVYGFTQRKMAYNSNKIEGSTLTENQIASLFDTGTLSSNGELIRSKDVEEATGHFIMFNNMLQTFNEELTEELIKNYHYDLKSGVFEDKANGYAIGEYKKRANTVSNIKVAKPDEVEKKMKELLSNYNKKKTHSLYDIIIFHSQYESIHPFQDGNGRTGRIIMFKECLKNHIFPFIIEDELKGEYYKSLNNAQLNNNYDDLLDFCKKEQENYFNNVKDFIYSKDELENVLQEEDDK